jgi:hypothetical protein
LHLAQLRALLASGATGNLVDQPTPSEVADQRAIATPQGVAVATGTTVRFCFGAPVGWFARSIDRNGRLLDLIEVIGILGIMFAFRPPTIRLVEQEAHQEEQQNNEQRNKEQPQQRT